MNQAHEPNIDPELRDNERWLAALPSPQPSARTIQRIKSALRAELLRRRHLTPHLRLPQPSSPLQRVAAALAAAAMLAVAVGLITVMIPRAGRSPAPADPVDLFVASLDSVVQPQDSPLASLRQELQGYEAQLAADLGDAARPSETDLPNLWEEFDSLLETNDQTWEG